MTKQFLKEDSNNSKIMIDQINHQMISSTVSELNGNNVKVYTKKNQKNRKQKIKQNKTWFLGRWFSNLPISRKHSISLYLSSILPLLAIAGVGALLILNTVKRQVEKQSRAEVAVTEINYLIKINQMGLGFRGHSDNTAIIEAAQLNAAGKPIPPELNQQVKQILQGEIRTGVIEYATLVGTDQRIIVNANSNRQGEVFNPENLVTRVIESKEHYKANGIVSAEELRAESSPLPGEFTGENALIRYTATPVKNPNTEEIMGVLISGDIVNGKSAIARDTINTFGDGYSAVYYRLPDGSFNLATSAKATDESSGKLTNIPFNEAELLKKAVENPGELITKTRIKIGENFHTVTATTLPNLWIHTPDGIVPVSENEPPIAILVRGAPQNIIKQLIINSILLLIGAAIIALLLSTWLGNILTKAISNPVKNLQKTTQRFAEGDHQIRSSVTSKDEIGQLATTFNQLADTISKTEKEQLAEIKRKQLLKDIYQAKNSEDLSVPLQALITEEKEKIKVDRMLIYRFLPDGTGYVAAESMKFNTPSALDETNTEILLDKESLEAYKRGEILVDGNISQSDYSVEQLELLKRLEVKSNIVIPIIQGEELIALLVAHNCTYYRSWQPEEINQLKELAAVIAEVLGGLALLETRQAETERAIAQNQLIQKELLKLINSLEGVATGDLTVHPEVSGGQVGVVADFFNTIVGSLRDIVTQVKQSTTRINYSLESEAKGISQLADESRQQAEKIQDMLNSVQQISDSIQRVANNASSAANVAQNASKVAKKGETTMNQTVDSILSLRETVSTTAIKVKRLGEASQKISKVIALINDIALKTNLLAVNASIEAARAGAEGRGFAVVAEEVGQLATQSSTATREIEQIVATIQLQTNELVEAMEIGTTEVVEGTELVTQVKASLGEIVAESEQIDQLVVTISQATLSQRVTSQMLTELMQEMAQISRETSKKSQTISKSLEETAAIAKEMQNSVKTYKQ